LEAIFQEVLLWVLWTRFFIIIFSPTCTLSFFLHWADCINAVLPNIKQILPQQFGCLVQVRVGLFYHLCQHVQVCSPAMRSQTFCSLFWFILFSWVPQNSALDWRNFKGNLEDRIWIGQRKVTRPLFFLVQASSFVFFFYDAIKGLPFIIHMFSISVDYKRTALRRLPHGIRFAFDSDTAHLPPFQHRSSFHRPSAASPPPIYRHPSRSFYGQSCRWAPRQPTTPNLTSLPPPPVMRRCPHRRIASPAPPPSPLGQTGLRALH
jgi:hypothetical protein